MSSSLLVDHLGRPMPVAVAPAWDSSGQGRRAANWRPTSSGINALLGEVETVRRRSRDAIRKNPWALNGVEAKVSNLVGTGIKPIPNTQDDAFRDELVEAWDEWCEESDVDGTQGFYGQQALIARSWIEGGECFVRFRNRRLEDGLSVPLQIQALEAELVDISLNRTISPGRRIKAGIEFDAFGRRRAYHMYREHPGDGGLTIRSSQRVPVPAHQVMHVFQPVRPGQVRGISTLAPILAKLYELDQYDDAEVVRKKVAAMFALFEIVPAQQIADPNRIGVAQGKDSDQVPVAALEPGTSRRLPPGHTVEFSKPADVGPMYAEFMRIQAHQLAAGIGVTYEQMTNDLKGVTFSSIRAGLIEFRRRIQQLQNNVMVFQLCRPVYRRWFEAAVISGRIQVPATEQSRLRSLMRPKWMATPGFEYVDPEKEVKSVVRAIRAGLTTRTQEVAKRGYDSVQIDREAAADNDRADALGLTFDSDARSDSDGAARAAALSDPQNSSNGGDDGEVGETGEDGEEASDGGSAARSESA